MNEEVRKHLDAGSALLRENNALGALAEFEAALALAPDSAEVFTLRGIALSQLSRTEEATTSFQRAIGLDPTNAKAFYNFATHLYQIGRKPEARTYASECLIRDPGHKSSQDLIALIDQEAMAPPVMPPTPGMPYGQPLPPETQYVRPGYAPTAGGLAFIDKLGPSWMVLGWAVIIVSCAISIYQWSVIFPAMSTLFENMGKTQNFEKEAMKMQGLIPLWLTILGYVSQIGAIAWGVADIVHKRGNFLWLAPLIICTCCGAPWMILPIYILGGRPKA